MRKIMLMVFVASVVALMLAASPASADELDDCELVRHGDELGWVCEDVGFDDGRLLAVDDGRFFDCPPDIDIKWCLFLTDLYSLRGANLEGAAMLDGADLTNADLRGVRGITTKQLERHD